MATKTETKPVTYIAKCSNLRVVISPKVGAERAPSGRLLVPEDPGHSIQFEDGQYTTTDEVEIEFMRNHRHFNSQFYEQGNAPDEPKPTVKTQLRAVTSAIAKADVKKLEKLAADERDSHDRAVVLDAIQDGLEAIASDDEPEDKPSRKTSTASA